MAIKPPFGGSLYGSLDHAHAADAPSSPTDRVSIGKGYVGAGTPLPTVRVELEGMKHAVARALSDRHLFNDEMVKRAVDDALAPANIQHILLREVNAAVQDLLEREIKHAFGTRELREVARGIVADQIKELLKGKNTEEPRMTDFGDSPY